MAECDSQMLVVLSKPQSVYQFDVIAAVDSCF